MYCCKVTLRIVPTRKFLIVAESCEIIQIS